jgi:hypothetical protein
MLTLLRWPISTDLGVLSGRVCGTARFLDSPYPQVYVADERSIFIGNNSVDKESEGCREVRRYDGAFARVLRCFWQLPR